MRRSIDYPLSRSQALPLPCTFAGFLQLTRAQWLHLSPLLCVLVALAGVCTTQRLLTLPHRRLLLLHCMIAMLACSRRCPASFSRSAAVRVLRAARAAARGQPRAALGA
jgi:hypothetical protein